MKSKTIIISEQNSSGRGILTLYMEDDLLKGKLRIYDLPKLSASCKLGIYHNNEVFSSNLIYKNGFYATSLVGNFNLDADFYTAIIDTSLNNKVILSGGTYAGFYFDDNSVFSPLAEEEKPTYEQLLADEDYNINYKHETEHPNQNIEAHETPQQNQTEPQPTLQTENLNCNHPDCANCKYKEYFYSNNPLPEILHTEEANKIETDKTSQIQENDNNITSIFDSLLPQFDYILKNYPENEELNKLIENAKFVRIAEGESNYSLGAIYENQNMQYICYAIKCNYNTPAPEELGKFYQWLPTDPTDPLSEGYYIVYQDAHDLKIIEI